MKKKDISINKKIFRVNFDEYEKVHHKEYNNLNILDKLGFQERQISLLKEISKLYENKVNIKMNDISHGGFIPINCSDYYNNIYINNNLEHSDNILYNILNHLKNKNIYYYGEIINDKNDLYEVNFDHPESSIIISLNKFISKNFITYQLTNLSTEWTPQPTLYVHVSNNLNESFLNKFKYYITSYQNIPILDYDNLINMCIMVKDAGPQFEDMLNKNMPIIDRWCILDTGSSDNTINIINNTLVGVKNGELYQEPFINFRDSRNRCLDLAGKDCKFIIMLDDTYVVDGNLREFLNIVRGDQFSTSFTLYINSDDTQYGSNRIIKSDSNLRYIHKIHEVITDKDNINIVIPINKAKILDGRFEYMQERTMKRKELDLKLLYEELEENPSDPRTYYYLAQTYNLLEQYEKSYEFFLKRASFKNSGFLQERVDSLFEAARTANFKLNKPEEEFMNLYEQCYKADESRPEALYFMGVHYFLKNEHKKAYHLFKKGFEIGYPEHCQYSLKPTLSFHFLPKFLTRLCYTMEDYKLGEQASLLFLQNNNENSENYEEIKSYYFIFKKLNEYCPSLDDIKDIKDISLDKPLFVFVADGGFNKWSGSNILTTGVGGSETYIIEMARYIQKNGIYQVVVFCNCENEEIFEQVQYKHLSKFPKFVKHTHIQHCIISRFTEYLPLAFKGNTENVYLVLHDLGPSGNVIPMDKKLKNIFCLTEWHVDYFTSQFPSLKNITVPFYYGIDFNNFKNQSIKKEPFKFIYSSFPNRGLLPLLEMWPRIYSMNSNASLHIYSDVNGKWVNQVDSEHMKKIKILLETYKNKMNIHYHGWVDKKTLAQAWLSSDIWLYPCIFRETFCLTALEAALTKTLVFTNDLAALQNTVGDRGIVIKGNPMSIEWQDNALEQIQLYFNEKLKNNVYNNNNNIYEKYRSVNYDWASTLSWKNRANQLLEQYIFPNYLEFRNSNVIEKNNLCNMILKYFISKNNPSLPINVLDINTQTGISLINILKFLESIKSVECVGCVGYGIDEWIDSDIQESFHKNVNKSILRSKILGIKHNVSKKIIDIIQEKIFFDIVNINYSDHYDYNHNWASYFKLLNKGGLMIINKYLFEKIDIEDDSIPLIKNNCDKQVYKRIEYCNNINNFLKDYQNEYKILAKTDILFIEKI